MRRELLAVAIWLVAVSGCSCPGGESAVDPSSGCCVPVDRLSSWGPCTFTCDAGDCAADQPHGLRNVIANLTQTAHVTMGRRISATIDLSCGP